MMTLTDKALRMLLRVSHDTAAHHKKQRKKKAQLKAVAKAEKVKTEASETHVETPAPAPEAIVSVARMRTVLVTDGIRSQAEIDGMEDKDVRNTLKVILIDSVKVSDKVCHKIVL
jgi:hypothetical protein